MHIEKIILNSDIKNNFNRYIKLSDKLKKHQTLLHLYKIYLIKE